MIPELSLNSPAPRYGITSLSLIERGMSGVRAAKQLLSSLG